MPIPTLLRLEEHRVLSRITLSGSVLDVGGDSRSDYRTHIKGDPVYTCINIDDRAGADIIHNLEQPLPIADASFDHALLINVLEHIDNAEQLLVEAARVVRPGGQVIVVVPFLFPYHPSPRDFRRFTPDALKEMVERAELTLTSLEPLGSGVFAARYVMLDRLLPFPLRFIRYMLFRPMVSILDSLFSKVAEVTRRKYSSSDYALGYAALARKV